MTTSDVKKDRRNIVLRATAAPVTEKASPAPRRKRKPVGRKAARNAAPEDEDKSYPFPVRLLASERRVLEARAATAGLEPSVYARACMLGPSAVRGRRVLHIDVAAAAQLALELLRISTRLNDLVGMLEKSDERERGDLVSLLRPDIAATLGTANEVLRQAKAMFLTQGRSSGAEDEDS